MRKALYMMACLTLLWTVALGQREGLRVTIRLERDVFADEYLLQLKANADSGINEYDAVKISDGFVSLAGIHASGRYLSAEERPIPSKPEAIPLYLKVFGTGEYQLRFKLSDWDSQRFELSLEDSYLQQQVAVTKTGQVHRFTIDTALKASAGTGRFRLLVRPGKGSSPAEAAGLPIVAFPNPFVDRLFLNVKAQREATVTVRLIDMGGTTRWEQQFLDVEPQQILELNCGQLVPGLYLLEWRPKGSKQKRITLKIIKI